jgi:hypothetical protein
VMVAGQWKKRDGQLLRTDLVSRLASLQSSGRKIVGALGLPSS